MNKIYQQVYLNSENQQAHLRQEPHIFLKVNKKLKTGFFKTDIEFGRGYAKKPVFIVDVETCKKMEKEKFKGFCGEKILDRYNWEK